MSAENKPPVDPMDAFTKMWTDLSGKMGQAGWTMPPGTAPADAAKKFREVFIQAMTEYSEQYMRSPEFLQGMKESFRQSVEFRKQMNDYLGHVQHEFQGPNRQDIDHVMTSIGRLESRLSTALQRLEGRIDEVAVKLDSLTPPAGKKEPHAESGKKKAHK